MSQRMNTAPAPAGAQGTVGRQRAPRTVKLLPMEVEAVTDRSPENWFFWKQALETLAAIERRRNEKLEERKKA